WNVAVRRDDALLHIVPLVARVFDGGGDSSLEITIQLPARRIPRRRRAIWTNRALVLVECGVADAKGATITAIPALRRAVKATRHQPIGKRSVRARIEPGRAPALPKPWRIGRAHIPRCRLIDPIAVRVEILRCMKRQPEVSDHLAFRTSRRADEMALDEGV